MKVAHIGPPLARQGGPAGYLLQLQQAAREAGATDILFPAPAVAAPSRPAPAPPSAFVTARRALGRVKRTVFGAPQFDRPSVADLEREGGPIDRVMADARRALVEETAASVAQARQSDADVWFCHDSATAAHLLEQPDRRQVWLFQHAPFPLAFYQTWCWGVPEWDWRHVAQLRDVSRWTSWETSVWKRVDRFVLPCPEALEELVRIDEDAASLSTTADYVLTGARVRATDAPTRARDELRAQWGFGPEPVGLYLGANQPYRGFDTLVAGLDQLTGRDAAGIIAVAGPEPDSLPSHPRLRPLGRVSDVAGLLDAVDFVVNVNRFSLFDLSTIEAVEAGKPLLMHAVGGNKTFKALGAGCVMIDDLAPGTVARGLRAMFTLPAGDREALGRASRACYEHHLTLAHFWRGHSDLYTCKTPQTS